MTTETSSPPAGEEEYKLTPPRRAPRRGLPTKGLIVLTGLPKSGKNSIALSVPGLALLETEKEGSAHLDGWVQETYDLTTFRRAFRAAQKDPSCRAIGVSTIDKLIGWWQDEICATYQVDSMSAQVEGVNLWNVLRQKVESFIDAAKTGGKLVIWLAHYKEPKLDKEGRVVITQNIDAPGKLGGLICAEADLIGACSKAKVGAKMQFKVSFVGGGEIGAFGGRVDELEGKEIVLPKGRQWAAIEAACVEGATEAPQGTSTEAATAAKTATAPAKTNGTTKAAAAAGRK